MDSKTILYACADERKQLLKLPDGRLATGAGDSVIDIINGVYLVRLSGPDGGQNTLIPIWDYSRVREIEDESVKIAVARKVMIVLSKLMRVDLLDEWVRTCAAAGAIIRDTAVYDYTVVDRASASGAIAVLDWWFDFTAGHGLPFKYTDDAIVMASKNRMIETLKWWFGKSNTIGVQYSAACIDNASIDGAVDVLDAWLSYSQKMGTRLLYTTAAIDKTTCVKSLNWWLHAGLTPKYSEAAIDKACKRGDVDTLNWWLQAARPRGWRLKYTGKATASAILGCKYSVIEWMEHEAGPAGVTFDYDLSAGKDSLINELTMRNDTDMLGWLDKNTSMGVRCEQDTLLVAVLWDHLSAFAWWVSHTLHRDAQCHASRATLPGIRAAVDAMICESKIEMLDWCFTHKCLVYSHDLLADSKVTAWWESKELPLDHLYHGHTPIL